MSTASSIRIEEQAAAWLTQRDGGEWTEADQHALQSWLDSSTAHEVAFIRLEAIWTAADRLQVLGSGVALDNVSPPNTWHLPPAPTIQAPAAKTSSRRFLAVAAGIALALVAVSIWYSQTETIYRTAVGGTSSVPMQDGSKVILNTDSEIRLAVTDSERAVHLDRGEAFFEVAPDPARPFVVKAGHQRITAVGTQFSVRRTDRDAVQVVVTEGRVRVDDDSSSKPILLSAGSVASSDAEGLSVQPPERSNVEEQLSWRSGFLVFREASLAEAAAEFNRYNQRKLLVEDPSIANIPVSGRFRITNFEAFVRLVESGFPVQAQKSSDGILLTRRGSTATE